MRAIRRRGSLGIFTLMKNNPVAFLFVVVVLRLTSVYLVLAAIYEALSLPALQLVSGGMVELVLLGFVRPIIASIALWFLSRTIAKLVLRGFEGTVESGKN
jgi:hypothetical protein